MTAAEIRQSFLDFFRSKGHVIVPSSPVVLRSDPTLLFANAGMNQFKDIFLGTRNSENKRVANTQKCVRVSGKHNDLEEVGHDTYHHTFFEMLGNWSFGDYYKREAIAWAWELLTEVWRLPKNRLWATVYRDDDEAAALWEEVTDIRRDHILRFGEKDNFWEMGETGPCGPCSEIHIDRTASGCGPELINAGTPDVIELWNLVFIQFNRRSDGTLEELKSKHVDTGMGLERLVAVLQGKNSNYDTDLFAPLLAELQRMTGHAYDGESAVAMRVIADHLRTLAFAIADGVLPSNEGRGYVLRRLLRRATRYARKIGLTEPFMNRLLPVLDDLMGDTFPELRARRADIARALQAEEESFCQTLDRGISLFEEIADRMARAGEVVFPGEEAFKLYDTYGFPIDLTRLMAAERGLTIDEIRFQELMDQQRERARAARKSKLLATTSDLISALVARDTRCEFTGYAALEDEGTVVALFAEGREEKQLNEEETGELVLNRTPFYAESGGQIGDKGMIRGPEGEFEVWDTQKPAEGIILHIGRVVQGRISQGDRVVASVDAERRARTARHHSATHLLQRALREVLGPSIAQAGSYVAPERLRFDFSYHQAVPADRLVAVERRVNEWIMANLPVKTYMMPFKDVAGSGIIALFDEKYGDVVRVVDMGGISRELCGGTHVHATGELGLFRITAESSVAAGVRRIEAVCGLPAYEHMRRERETLRHLSQRLSVAIDELPQRIEALLETQRRLEKQLRERTAESAAQQALQLLEKTQSVAGVPLLAVDAGEGDLDVLRAMMDALRPNMPSGVIVLAGRNEEKACFMAFVSDEWVQRGIHAGKLVGEIARVTDGGGGGQPNRAQAGGRDPSKIPIALARVPDLLKQMLSR